MADWSQRRTSVIRTTTRVEELSRSPAARLVASAHSPSSGIQKGCPSVAVIEVRLLRVRDDLTPDDDWSY